MSRQSTKTQGEAAETVAIHPVTPDRWDDLVVLFDRRGGCRNCWCMWWRLTGREFQALSGEQKRDALKRLVAERPPGLLAYRGVRSVGWCSLGPRDTFVRLVRSPLARAAGDGEVWSLVQDELDFGPSLDIERASEQIVRDELRHPAPYGAPREARTSVSLGAGPAAAFRPLRA